VSFLFLRTVGSIVVTGGTGFVGSHLIRRLLLPDQGPARIVVIDNSGKLSKERIPGLNAIPFDNKDLTVYQEDMRHGDAISDILRGEKPIDIFIHLAARGNVLDTNIDPQEILDININGTRNVLDACSVNNVSRFIFASSAAVYGEAKKLPLSEDHPLVPISNYGLSKAKAEALVSSYMSTGKIQSTISLRIFNIYGDGDQSGVTYRFSKRLSSGLAPVIYGDGNQVRDFISVTDVVESILLASDSKIGGEFNIGTGIPITINDLARRMISIYGLHIDPSYSPNDLGKNTKHNTQEIRNSYADIRKSAKLLNFTAESDIALELNEIRKKISV
jgi:UDP-glucose 4-epimerase